MPLQIVEFSKTLDKNKFVMDFINHPLEEMYFKFYPLDHDFILIKSDDKVVLKTMVCTTPHAGISYFGLFNYDINYEAKNDVLKLFKNYLIEWNRERGLGTILGPINFSTWLSYRLPSFSDGGPKFSFEPSYPPNYILDLKQIGFTTHKTYSSKGFGPISQFVNSTRKDYENAASLGYTFEFLPKSLEENHINELYRLSLIGFEKNYLATPIDLTTFKNLYKIGSGVNDYTNSILVKSITGQAVGFFICFIEEQYAICKTVAIDPKFRGHGLSNALFHLGLDKAQSSGVNGMVSAMVIEGAQSESYGKKMTLKWTHLYEILEYLT